MSLETGPRVFWPSLLALTTMAYRQAKRSLPVNFGTPLSRPRLLGLPPCSGSLTATKDFAVCLGSPRQGQDGMLELNALLPLTTLRRF
ncbi:hypothetical protein PoB_004039400 [Plakobranchus ocellatus]|uniref:Secreted protein n=1 Tax=Plakobranchus ocellatus TaxID=259542 RepID=A0AAV4B694_9GAST|nr:hypothetical protein PoB_004039400 [Plakobranchus ocellatus]